MLLISLNANLSRLEYCLTFVQTLKPLCRHTPQPMQLALSFFQVYSDGQKRPVVKANLNLSYTKRKNKITECQILAFMWACERWVLYLYGRHFELRTDNNPLATLMCGGDNGHKPLRILRCTDQLGEYSISISYKPSAQKVVAELLSRAFPANALASSMLDELNIRTLLSIY